MRRGWHPRAACAPGGEGGGGMRRGSVGSGGGGGGGGGGRAPRFSEFHRMVYLEMFFAPPTPRSHISRGTAPMCSRPAERRDQMTLTQEDRRRDYDKVPCT